MVLRFTLIMIAVTYASFVGDCDGKVGFALVGAIALGLQAFCNGAIMIA